MFRKIVCSLLFLPFFTLLSTCDFQNEEADISGEWTFSYGESYTNIITSSNQVALNPASEENGCIYVSGEFTAELKHFEIDTSELGFEFIAMNSFAEHPYIIYLLLIDNGQVDYQQIIIQRSNDSYEFYRPISIEYNFDEDNKSFKSFSSLFCKYDQMTGITDSNTVVTLSGSTQFKRIDVSANTPLKLESDNSWAECIEDYKIEFDTDGNSRYRVYFSNPTISDSIEGVWSIVDQHLTLISENSDTNIYEYKMDHNTLILIDKQSCEEMEISQLRQQCFEKNERFYNIEIGSLISSETVHKLYFQR